MLPETMLAALARVRLRLRLRAMLLAIAAGGALFAAALIVSHRIDVAAALGIALAFWLTARNWRIPLTAAARHIEASDSTLDNLLITAAELEEQPRPVPAEIREAIAQQAAARLQHVDVNRAVRLAQPFVAALAVVIGCGVLGSLTGNGTLQFAPLDNAAPPPLVTSVSVRITPPAYTRRQPEVLENPLQVTALEGSEVVITSLVEGAPATPRQSQRVIARESASFELRAADDAEPRFLSLIVVPDAPPSVQIVAPGRDTALAAARGTLTINIEGRDDLGLSSLVMRFTKASGGGENVAFTEGEVPLSLERRNERQWLARAQWTLDNLGLGDGDVLVYRAIARDANPAGTPVQSDAFLIEIGRASEIASAGFALPAEEKKYAISQQMVIYKTEQLIASAGGSAPSRSLGEGWLEQTRMIGIEQRMVRAEVVFLSGGEVQDEVEEAAHSHELAEGRLENPGRAEMVRALNFMSRAEAQLNDGKAEAALVFERQALASLERALDRRRYFLRTLPDRSRIDVTRRLTGDRADARSWPRPRAAAAPIRGLEQQRAVMRELAAASKGEAPVDASLAARLAAVDPRSLELQKAAVGIASAVTDAGKRAAARVAMQSLTTHALRTLPSSMPLRIERDPLAGRLGDALARVPR